MYTKHYSIDNIRKTITDVLEEHKLVVNSFDVAGVFRCSHPACSHFIFSPSDDGEAYGEHVRIFFRAQILAAMDKVVETNEIFYDNFAFTGMLTHIPCQKTWVGIPTMGKVVVEVEKHECKESEDSNS